MAAVVDRRAVLADRYRHIVFVWNERRIVGRRLQGSAVQRDRRRFRIGVAGTVVDESVGAYPTAARHVYRCSRGIVIADVDRCFHQHFTVVHIKRSRAARPHNHAAAVRPGADILILASV